MEQDINRVELQGRVGSIKVSDIEGTKLVRMTVCTNEMYTSRDGYGVVETTWHNVSYWEKPGDSHKEINKGDTVHIVGRLKNQRYTDRDGRELSLCEIIVSELKVI